MAVSIYIPALQVELQASLVEAFSPLVSAAAAVAASVEFCPSCHPCDFAALQTSSLQSVI